MKTIKSLVNLLTFCSLTITINAECVVTSPCGNFAYEESVINVSSSNVNGVLTITVRNPEGEVIDEINCEESGVVSTSCTSLLPVELVSFTIESLRSSSVLLEWETGSEINNDFFEILHSTDGRTFEVIGKVNGALTSNKIQHYSFLDKKAVLGLNFYKLRQVDTNGDFEDSALRAIELTPPSIEANIYPNPATDHVEIKLPNNKEDVNLYIYDSTGRLFIKKSITSESNEFNFNIATLESGIYWIRLDSTRISQSSKLVKL